MRDDFSSKTKELLAKRVAYKCSNPQCKNPTIGANSMPNKTLSIGVASHITAASIGGPRYNANLTKEQRSDIENGIWLCQNCSVLIDKDVNTFTIEVLEDWKARSEDDAFKALQQKELSEFPQVDKLRPYADAELVWTFSSKNPQGASPKTIEKYGDTPISIMEVIWYNNITWTYELKIYNNSSVGLFNLKIHQHPTSKFFKIKETLPKINNLPPYRDLSFIAETFKFFEGTGKEANELMNPTFPEQIQGMRLLLEYISETRVTYYTEVKLIKDSLEITHLDSIPEDYY